jgi:hypothetical protein
MVRLQGGIGGELDSGASCIATLWLLSLCDRVIRTKLGSFCVKILSPLVIGVEKCSVENEEFSSLSIDSILCLVSRCGPESALRLGMW